LDLGDKMQLNKLPHNIWFVAIDNKIVSIFTSRENARKEREKKRLLGYKKIKILRNQIKYSNTEPDPKA
jgi:hypothetical protein